MVSFTPVPELCNAQLAVGTYLRFGGVRNAPDHLIVPAWPPPPPFNRDKHLGRPTDSDERAHCSGASIYEVYRADGVDGPPEIERN